MSDVLATAGEAVFESAFTLRGRGTVLVLGKVEGIVPRDGMLWNGNGAVPYEGPDFMDGPNSTSRLTILVADSDFGKFREGCSLKFTRHGKISSAG